MGRISNWVVPLWRVVHVILQTLTYLIQVRGRHSHVICSIGSFKKWMQILEGSWNHEPSKFAFITYIYI